MIFIGIIYKKKQKNQKKYNFIDILILIKLILKKTRNLFQDLFFFLQKKLLYIILRNNR
jgi:hypothetical protein